jgi:hypothetical protein
VVDHKIAPAGQLGGVELDLLRIHQKILVSEGGKPQG